MPTLYIPHGGGPCFFMDWTMGPPDTWDAMADWLKRLAASLGQKPRAILVISGHWEEPAFTVTGNSRPELIYDYYGFRRTPISSNTQRRAPRRWRSGSVRCSAPPDSPRPPTPNGASTMGCSFPSS